MVWLRLIALAALLLVLSLVAELARQVFELAALLAVLWLLLELLQLQLQQVYDCSNSSEWQSLWLGSRDCSWWMCLVAEVDE